MAHKISMLSQTPFHPKLCFEGNQCLKGDLS